MAIKPEREVKMMIRDESGEKSQPLLVAQQV
jgi:hypothetical protein